MPSAGTQDYFNVLGVKFDANEDEIKRAFKALALQWHPDRHVKDKAAANAKFIEVHDAYRFLIDKSSRRSQSVVPPPPASRPRARRPGSFQPSPSKVPSPPTTRTSTARPRASAPRSRPVSDPGAQGDDEYSDRIPKDSGKSKGGRADPGQGPRSGTRRMSPSVDETVVTPLAHFSLSASAHVPSSSTSIPVPPKPHEFVYPLILTLEELCNGTTHRYRITRLLLSGRSVRVEIDIRVLPGWRRGTALRFRGLGNEVELPAVSAEGVEAETQVGAEDMVFVVMEAAHPRFVRVNGGDLALRERVRVGRERGVWVEGVDGEPVYVPVRRGESEARVVGKGMPVRDKGSVIGRGDLLVRWDFSSTH